MIHDAPHRQAANRAASSRPLDRGQMKAKQKEYFAMPRKGIVVAAVCAVVFTGVNWLTAQQHKAGLTADDYVEIQQLYARYNNAIDSGDAEGYALPPSCQMEFSTPSRAMTHWSVSSTTGARK